MRWTRASSETATPPIDDDDHASEADAAARARSGRSAVSTTSATARPKNIHACAAVCAAEMPASRIAARMAISGLTDRARSRATSAHTHRKTCISASLSCASVTTKALAMACSSMIRMAIDFCAIQKHAAASERSQETSRCGRAAQHMSYNRMAVCGMCTYSLKSMVSCK